MPEKEIILKHFNDISTKYDENNKILIGENTGKTYKVGDRVNIKVKNASKELRQIDFELF